MLLGFALAAILVWRIVRRSGAGRWLQADEEGLLHLAAKATRLGLDLLLVTIVTIGVVNAVVRGHSLYGLVRLPQFGDQAWRRLTTQWHGLAASIIGLALAGFHAAAAAVDHSLCAPRPTRCPHAPQAPQQTGRPTGPDVK